MERITKYTSVLVSTALVAGMISLVVRFRLETGRWPDDYDSVWDWESNGEPAVLFPNLLSDISLSGFVWLLAVLAIVAALVIRYVPFEPDSGGGD